MEDFIEPLCNTVIDPVKFSRCPYRVTAEDCYIDIRTLDEDSVYQKV